MRRPLETLLALVALACGRGSAAPPDAAALSESALVEIAAEAECARLRAQDPPGGLEPHLAAALAKRGVARAELNDAVRRHPEAGARIDERVASCRRAAGWQERPGDGGLLWEKLPP